MTRKKRRPRYRRQPLCSPALFRSHETTGPPDTTLARGGEARPANSWDEDSQLEATVPDACCRRRGRRGRPSARWSRVLADIGVFLGGVAIVVPDDVGQRLVEFLVGLLS